jgi:cytochrome c peroxidase
MTIFEGRGTCSSCHPNQINPDGGKPLFTNFRYYNIGVPKNPRNPFYNMPPSINPDGQNYVDLGLGGVLGIASENGKFKVPSLRNASLTPPYMHNGVFTSLSDVVMFMNTRDVDSRWGPPEVPPNVALGPMTGLQLQADNARILPGDPGNGSPREPAGTLGNLKLTPVEVDQVVAFLETLRDGPALVGQ